jgi:prophage endopeptidase
MSPYVLTGIIAGALGIAIGGASVHTVDATKLSVEQAAHARDNAAHANEIASINAASAKQLADALQKQQAAEGKVAAIETQYTNEVNAHAADSLKYRADLASGAQRVRVRVASCGAVPASGQSTAAAGRTDAAPAYADLDATVAASVFKVAADDQVEIDKLAALQAYVKTLQDEGYIQK